MNSIHSIYERLMNVMEELRLYSSKTADICDCRVGDVIYSTDNKRESCLALEEQLIMRGYETKVSYNPNTHQWSVEIMEKGIKDV